jgi:hypothetical protein
MLELLLLHLGGDGQATSEDHINLYQMLVAVVILSMAFAPAGILRCQDC